MNCEHCGRETETPVMVKAGGKGMLVGPECAKQGIKSGEFKRYTDADRIREVLKSQPGITVSTSTGQIKRNGKIIGYASKGSGWGGGGFLTTTTSRRDGSSIRKDHASREAAINYVLAHGWAYGEPRKETDEQG